MGHGYAVQSTPFAAYSQDAFPELHNSLASFAKEPPTHYLSATQLSQSNTTCGNRNVPVLLLAVLLACVVSAAYFSATVPEADMAVSGQTLQAAHRRDSPDSLHDNQAGTLRCHIMHSTDRQQHSTTDTAVCSQAIGSGQQQRQQITIWQAKHSTEAASSSSTSGISSSYAYGLLGQQTGGPRKQLRRQLRLISAV